MQIVLCGCMTGSADAEQQWMGGLPLGIDKADLLEVRAPKPTQALITTDDTVFPVQGGRDCVQVRLLDCY